MASAPASSPGQRHCIVFLGKTLNRSHCAHLHPGVWMGTDDLNAEGNPVIAPQVGGVEKQFRRFMPEKQDKHKPDGPLGT